MKKPPTRKGKAFKIPRPENSRPLIAAAILTIIALACGALALAGRIRPAEERQTPAYVPPTRPPISIDAPEGWRVFSWWRCARSGAPARRPPRPRRRPRARPRPRSDRGPRIGRGLRAGSGP